MAVAQFRARAKEVRAYLRSLRELEAAHRLPGRGFYRARAAIEASRASSFIMIYNCVEYSLRHSVAAIRSDIKTNATSFTEVTDYWQDEIVRIRFHAQLVQGVDHKDFLKRVARFMPGRLEWGNAMQSRPFSGNVDHELIIDLAKQLEYNWSPPKGSLGGSDLRLVRDTRNGLAHGDETFEAIGSRYTTEDLIDKLDRIRLFMISFLASVNRYQARRDYLRS